MAEMTTRQRALKMLERREHSRAELIKKLVEKGETAENAEEAADYLVSIGFVDDMRFAAMLVRHCAAKGYGARRVKLELQRRGVARELWDEALEEMPEQDETVDRLLRQKLGGADASDRRALKKATDTLARRGYGWDEISAAVERLRNEEYEL